MLLDLVGYWVKCFLNSDSAQQQKLKLLGGESMSNKPPDSKQPRTGLSKYQSHLPLPCENTRNPHWSSECGRAGHFLPHSPSCVQVGSAGWEKRRFTPQQCAPCGITPCGRSAAPPLAGSWMRNSAMSFPFQKKPKIPL